MSSAGWRLIRRRARAFCLSITLLARARVASGHWLVIVNLLAAFLEQRAARLPVNQILRAE